LYKLNKFDEALNILESLIEEAIKYYKDELCYEMSKYYYALGTIRLGKIENSNDIFGG